MESGADIAGWRRFFIIFLVCEIYMAVTSGRLVCNVIGRKTLSIVDFGMRMLRYEKRGPGLIAEAGSALRYM